MFQDMNCIVDILIEFWEEIRKVMVGGWKVFSFLFLFITSPLWLLPFLFYRNQKK